MSLYIKTGHKMIIFGTVIKEISFADELLRNNGYKISEIELFTIITKNGLILSEIISLMQISNVFFKNIQLSLTCFMKKMIFSNEFSILFSKILVNNLYFHHL